MINIDRAKKIIGEKVYEAIGNATKDQLENWEQESRKEFITEPNGSERKTVLYYEINLIKARLI